MSENSKIDFSHIEQDAWDAIARSPLARRMRENLRGDDHHQSWALMTLELLRQVPKEQWPVSEYDWERFEHAACLGRELFTLTEMPPAKLVTAMIDQAKEGRSIWSAIWNGFDVETKDGKVTVHGDDIELWSDALYESVVKPHVVRDIFREKVLGHFVETLGLKRILEAAQKFSDESLREKHDKKLHKLSTAKLSWEVPTPSLRFQHEDQVMRVLPISSTPQLEALSKTTGNAHAGVAPYCNKGSRAMVAVVPDEVATELLGRPLKKGTAQFKDIDTILKRSEHAAHSIVVGEYYLALLSRSVHSWGAQCEAPAFTKALAWYRTVLSHLPHARAQRDRLLARGADPLHASGFASTSDIDKAFQMGRKLSPTLAGTQSANVEDWMTVYGLQSIVAKDAFGR